MSVNNTCGLEESFIPASLTDPHEAADSTEQLDNTAEVDQEHADLMESIREGFEVVERILQDAYDLPSDILSALLPIARQHPSFTILQKHPCRQLIHIIRCLETSRSTLAELWNGHADFCEVLRAVLSNTSNDVRTIIEEEVTAERRQGLRGVEAWLTQFEDNVVRFDSASDILWEKCYGVPSEQTGNVRSWPDLKQRGDFEEALCRCSTIA